MKIAVIGAGAAGRQFAAACAGAGFSVCLEDVMPSKLRHAGDALAAIGHEVRLVTTVEDAVQDADIAVDFVPDELESKLEIFSLLDRMAPPRTVLCTPSEILSITDLASCTYRADRCVMVRGLHSGSLSVQILTAKATSAMTLLQTRTLFQALGMTMTIESDPDLPMLMKNMGDTSLAGR